MKIDFSLRNTGAFYSTSVDFKKLDCFLIFLYIFSELGTMA